MAFVEKRGPGRWRARYRGPDGRERSKTFERRSDADRWVATQEADKARGAWVDPALGRVRFREWAEQWRGTVLHLRPSSLVRTDGILSGQLEPRFGDMPLAAIRPTDVRAMVGELAGAGMAPAGIHRVYAVLRSVLKAAEESGMIGRSPCTGIKMPRARRGEPRFLSVEDLHAVTGAIAPRYRALVLVDGYGGLRWSELVALRIDRVDFLRRRLTVEEALVEVAGRFHAGPTKTGPSRVVTLPALVVDELAAHVAAYPPGPDRLVFTAPGGGPVRRTFRTRAWIPALKAAGIAEPLPRIHDLRHTAAALAIAAGAHPKAIADRLGHASITTTLNVYGHLFPALDEQLAGRLDEMARSVPAASVRPGAPIHPIYAAQTGSD